MKYKLILASGSPRRKEILAALNINFDVYVSDAKEIITSEKPDQVVMELSDIKASAVENEINKNGVVIIGSDTVVALDNKILGKPKDKKEAYSMISSIQGRTHEVYTGVTVIAKDDNGNITKDIFSVCTKVMVNQMDEQEIEAYISTSEPYDKAGGYGIQGIFSKHIKGIEGDYFNVVGLPISEVYKRINQYEYI